MNVVTLDFETYYDATFSLKRLTVPEYVHDPRFHVHGLAIRWPDGRLDFRVDVVEVLAELQHQFGQNLANITVVVHNAYFDLYILRHRFGFSIQYFVDTMLLSHHVDGRKGEGGQSASLGAVAKRYGLQAKGDIDFMSGVRHPDARQLADLGSYARNDVEITFQAALRLLPEISRPEIELPLMMHTVRLFTERSISVDTTALSALTARISVETERRLSEAGVTADVVSKDGGFTKLLAAALAKTGRRVPLKQGKNGLIPATAKKDGAMQALVNDDDPVVATLAQARTQKKSEDQLLAKLDTLKRVTNATGGVLPPYLLYGGAHTLRFSGGGKFNIQNLGRDGFGLEMRRLLTARNENKLIIGDLAQIEARVLAWLAGQEDLLADFAAGKDIYSEFASQVLGETVRKPEDDEPKEIKKHLKSRRQLGKFAILGLGYSMGALRCMNQLRADPITAPLFDSGVLSPLVCRDIVKAYRAHYPRIPQLWRDLEAGFRAAVDGQPGTVGRIRFEKAGSVVLIRLPSGRVLRYPDAKVTTEVRTIHYLDKSGEQAEFTPDGTAIIYGPSGAPLYGGKITENVVQSVARDILVEAILGLEADGWPVLFHVHDEIVLEVLALNAKPAQAALKRELEAEPMWAEGLPLAAEVGVMERYGK